jgi:hypothetical protein
MGMEDPEEDNNGFSEAEVGTDGAEDERDEEGTCFDL